MVAFSRIACLGAFVVACACLGCGSSERKVGETTHRPGNPPITSVADDDPRMLAAIKKAQDTADEFISALKNAKRTQTMFSVKIPIKDGAHTEHMWVTPVTFQDGKFKGVMANEPDNVKKVKLGQSVEASKTEISDWMYVDGRKLVGGYTLRALRDILPTEERAEFDKSIPFVIE